MKATDIVDFLQNPLIRKFDVDPVVLRQLPVEK